MDVVEHGVAMKFLIIDDICGLLEDSRDDGERVLVPPTHRSIPWAIPNADKVMKFVAEHTRPFCRDGTSYDPWHYMSALERKPGG